MRDPAFSHVELPREKPNRMEIHPERADFGFSPVNHASQVACLT